MKQIFARQLALAGLLATLGFQWSALAQGTAFTYQGRLNDTASPINGFFDLRFALYDSTATPGTLVAGPLTTSAVPITNGLFTVTLDFGAGIFDGHDRWLDISVRTNGTGTFSVLDSRQKLTPTPYAITAANVASGGLAAGTYGNALTLNNPANNFSGNGAALLNVNALTLDGFGYCNLPCYWNLTGNAGTTAGINFLGTTDNQPLTLKINNVTALQIMPGTTLPNVVAGLAAFRPSVLGTNVSGVVISGGNAPSGSFTGDGGGDFMAAYDDDGAIGGGFGNKVGSNNGDPTDAAFATVGGGIFNAAANFAATVGGGAANLAGGSRSVVAGGNGNQATGNYSFVGGGLGNTSGSDYATAGGGLNNLSTGTNSTVGGGSGNLATGLGATIGGGQQNSTTNGVFEIEGAPNIGTFSTVGGGALNGAGGDFATVGGGYANAATYASTTIGGGSYNTANSDYATLGGGYGNTNSGFAATIGGGQANLSSGVYATVPGGYLNSAAGNNSFAAGQRAKANYPGSFVWADSQNADFSSTTNDQFAVRAQNGVQLSPTTSIFFGNQTRQMLNLWGAQYGIGVQSLTTYFRADNVTSSSGFSWYKGGVHNDGQNNPGGGTELMRLNSAGLTVNGIVVSASDRNLKENFEPVSGQAVLEKVAALPVSKWNFKTDPGTRHLGPMAQDFYAAFGVGLDDKHIATVDEDGVALAAIQGLNEKVEEKEARIRELEQRCCFGKRA